MVVEYDTIAETLDALSCLILFALATLESIIYK